MAYFGEGKGPIHVDNVKCTGVERSLADCIKQDIGKHNCRHSEDAGVICDYFSKKMMTAGPKGMKYSTKLKLHFVLFGRTKCLIFVMYQYLKTWVYIILDVMISDES